MSKKIIVGAQCKPNKKYKESQPSVSKVRMQQIWDLRDFHMVLE